MKLTKQEYYRKPLIKREIQGASSRSIFRFMTAQNTELSKLHCYPLDVDDFERNRALLLWYPEWKKRLPEMCIISPQWANLVNNWSTIEALYDEDYIVHGNMAYNIGKCCKYIRSLVKI